MHRLSGHGILSLWKLRRSPSESPRQISPWQAASAGTNDNVRLNMIAHPKSLAAILIGFTQIASFVVLYDCGFHIAAKLGREYRRSVGYGMMLHFTFLIFVFAAFAVPISLLACRTRKPAVAIVFCFLAAWSFLILPCTEVYPLRASFLFVLGVLHVLAFGWVVSQSARRFHPPESATSELQTTEAPF